jgi:hypothetical protein
MGCKEILQLVLEDSVAVMLDEPWTRIRALAMTLGVAFRRVEWHLADSSKETGTTVFCTCKEWNSAHYLNKLGIRIFQSLRRNQSDNTLRPPRENPVNSG